MKQIRNKLKKIIPDKLVKTYYLYKPEIHAANIYILRKETLIEELVPIDPKYLIRQLTVDDTEKIKMFYGNYTQILPRLEDTAWVGLAVLDSTVDKIAYVSWVVTGNIGFTHELKIDLNKNQFMVRHGYCDPEYRHQGLHTRMEQERLNWCIRNDAREIYVHIASRNQRGIETLIKTGYSFIRKIYIVRIPAFGIHRELFSFLKNPFRRVY